MGTVIVVCSGKGGTGKTSLSGACGMALAGQGARVLCIDCDIGLRNLDIALGMTDTVLIDFTDVMAGRCSLARALVPHPLNERLFLLTAPLRLGPEPLRQEDFKALLAEARAQFDYILIDAPAGVGPGFELAACDADEAIVVATSDASSLRDAQRVVASLLSCLTRVRLVVNRVSPRLLRRLGMTIDDIMDFVGLPLLGLVPEDPQVILSASRGQALLPAHTKGAALAFSNIARRIAGETLPLMKIR